MVVEWCKEMMLLGARNCKSGFKPGLKVCCNQLNFNGGGKATLDAVDPLVAIIEEIKCNEDLVAVGSLQTCSCYTSFQRTANSIAGIFSLRSSKEDPFPFKAKISLMVKEVYEIILY